MIRSTLVAVMFFSLPVPSPSAPEAPASDAKSTTEPGKGAAAGEGKLPADVQNFHGKITGTVGSVDTKAATLKVKVISVEADAGKNKAPKPGALAGMTITVTPLQKNNEAGDETLDEAAVAYIKGARTGDAVTLDVRASSKGVVFRLLKVPSAAGAK
jgi:hypothetical protein